MNTIGAILRGVLRPLKSRKVRTAIVGAVVSLAARYGLDLEPADEFGIQYAKLCSLKSEAQALIKRHKELQAAVADQ